MQQQTHTDLDEPSVKPAKENTAFPSGRCATLHSAIQLMYSLRQQTTELNDSSFTSKVPEQRSNR